MPDNVPGNVPGNGSDQYVYEGFPFISNIAKFVQNEINRREYERNEGKVPFIKAIPGFSSKCSGETGKYILRGIESNQGDVQSKYTFDQLYRPLFNYRPKAGIKSLSIEYKNALGSIRKATFEWTCHTLEDLERLSPYFLTPGYHIYLEWGWSTAAEHSEENPNIKVDNAFEYGMEKIQNSNGNMDVLLGSVTNYSFKLNRDGGYDCTTEIMSSGYLLEGITIPNQHTVDINEGLIRLIMNKKNIGRNKAITFLNNGENVEETLNLNAKFSLEAFLNYYYYSFIKVLSKKYNNAYDNEEDYFILIGDAQQKGGLSHSGNIKTKFLDSGVKAADLDEKPEPVNVRNGAYISWGLIEDMILNFHSALKYSDGSDNKLILGFNSRRYKLGYHDYLRSTDLGVCILPFINQDARNINAHGSGYYQTTHPVPHPRRGEEVKDGEHNYIYPRRILVNIDYFKDTMLKASTIIDGVLSVWAGINNACGNYWNIKVKMSDKPSNIKIEEVVQYGDAENEQVYDAILDKDNDYRDNKKSRGLSAKSKIGHWMIKTSSKEKIVLHSASIIDVNSSGKFISENKRKKSDIYMFSIKSNRDGFNPKSSIIKDISFSSKLSEVVCTNLFFAAQGDGSTIIGQPQTNTFRSLYDYGDDFQNGCDTFCEKISLSDDEDEITDNTKEEVKPIGTYAEKKIKLQYAYGKDLIRFLPWRLYGYYPYANGIYFDGVEGMRMAVQISDGTTPATNTALVKLECSLTLEGISGIRIGNVYTLDHIPKIYQDHGLFQVVGINERIDKTYWQTEIKTQFRVFNDIDYAKIKENRNVTSYRSSGNSSSISQEDYFDNHPIGESVGNGKKLTYLFIHCTSTPEGQPVTSNQIREWHIIDNKWKKVGYSDMIHLNGDVEQLHPYNEDDIVDQWEITNGVLHQNKWSRHIVYVGGLAKDGETFKDTRTESQRKSLEDYVLNMIREHPDILIAGHNQFSNKGCPCFYVPNWLESIRVLGGMKIPEKNIYRGGRVYEE